jgi:hypothetical protein
MDKGGKAIHDRFTLKPYSADLDDSISATIKPGGFQVQSDKGALGHVRLIPSEG